MASRGRPSTPQHRRARQRQPDPRVLTSMECCEATSVAQRHSMLAAPFESNICVRAVPGKGNALFAASNIEDGCVVLYDRPLCWQPLSASQYNCIGCGAFLGTCGEQLSRLAGAKIALPELPDLPAVPKEKASFGKGADREILCDACDLRATRPDAKLIELLEQHQPDDDLAAVHSAKQFLLLAAQLVRRIADRQDHSPMLPTEALASPEWWEVAARNEQMTHTAQLSAMRAELQSALSCIRAHYQCKSKEPPTIEGFARMVGGMARNAITVQVPSPLVGYMVAVEGLPETDPKRARLMEKIAKAVERLKEAHGEESDNEGEESDDDDNDDDDDDEEEDNDDDDEEESGDEAESSSEEESDDDAFPEEEVPFCWELGAQGSSSRAPRGQAATAGDAAKTGRRVEFSSRLFPSHKGWAVYPLLSLANHSCVPNCEVVFFSSNVVHLITTRPVAAGEELCISCKRRTTNHALEQCEPPP